MEQEELIKERDELFESIKSDLKEWAKIGFVLFIIFIILFGIAILSAVYGTMSPILSAVMCTCILVLLSYFTYCFNKNIKTNNAQDFLTFYDKQKPMMKWMSIILFSLLLIAILIELISKKDTFGLFMFAGMALVSYFFSYIGHTRDKQEDFKNDIKRLRELVQQTSNKV